MIKTIKGIVISETPYKESSKILNVLTEDGIIGVISKGCKNIKSPLRIISNKLSLNEFVIYYHEDSLSTLKEGSSVVLQHDIKDFSVDAVERIIQYGQANGYTFEKLTPASPKAHHGVNN